MRVLWRLKTVKTSPQEYLAVSRLQMFKRLLVPCQKISVVSQLQMPKPVADWGCLRAGAKKRAPAVCGRAPFFFYQDPHTLSQDKQMQNKPNKEIMFGNERKKIFSPKNTHIYTHTHSHVSCARAHANLSVQIHIYARPHMNAHDTCIHHPSPHTHTLVSMYIFQPPWPSFFFVLFRLFPSPLFLSLCPHLLSCWLWIMYYILMEWEKLAWGYHSPLNDH